MLLPAAVFFILLAVCCLVVARNTDPHETWAKLMLTAMFAGVVAVFLLLFAVFPL